MVDIKATSRRDFLKTSIVLSGGLLISFKVPQAKRLMKGLEEEAPEVFVPNAFLKINKDNSINVILSHVEMGQGIWTTLPMLIAEELDADWKDIKVEHSPAGQPWNHTVYGIQITGGSSTTWSEFDRYRNAGATARVLLVQAGAKAMGVSEDSCKTENGYVIAGDKKMSYGELAGAAALLTVPEKITLREPGNWRFIGKGVKRLDASVKTNGTAKFGMDVQAEGLLTAVVEHSPVVGGKVKSFDATNAKAVPGVKQVVEIPTGVAVLADNYWSALQGRKALKVIWQDTPNALINTKQQIANYRKLYATDGKPAAEKGNAKTALAKATKTIDAEYILPYLAHAAMEPLNCTVKLKDGKCEIWTGTQLPGVDQMAASKILGLQPADVTINTVFLGGGFGRRATPDSDFVSEAVHIAKASGQFIKMVWTREDDMKGGYYRPMFVHKVKVGMDAKGQPLAWHHNIVGQSIMEGTMFDSHPPNGIDESSVEGISDSPYMSSIPDHFIGLHTTRMPIKVLWLRSVGHTHTGFVMETMIEQLANAAKQDSVEYRRNLLKGHDRHLAALNLVAEKSGWSKPLPAGHFRGVAVHESFGSFVAQVVEISVVNKKIKVHKVTCTIDCGLAVNPDGVKAQMESGIIFGLTMALYGQVTIDKGQVQQNNFYDYKILRMNESPEIEVHIVDSTKKMGGAGECGVPPTAPALVNAIYAATGKRIYNLPIMNTFPNNI